VKIEFPEKKNISKEMLPHIVERIFAICKTDRNFPLKQKMNSIDDQIKRLQQKINKQENLLLQSKQLNNNILSRLSNLKNSNQELRDKLLESLGSDL
jgi:septal ring factor EnvC (AmiA/AmiB activator)